MKKNIFILIIDVVFSFQIRTMYNNSRRDMDEGNSEFSINPDPVPYQPSNFM